MKNYSKNISIALIVFVVVIVVFMFTKDTKKDYLVPTIVVLSPNGGETFKVGSVIPLEWSSKNTTSNFEVTFYNVDSPGLSKFRVKSIKSSGTDNIKITTDIIPGKYKIVLEDFEGDLASKPYGDGSDNYFTIIP